MAPAEKSDIMVVATPAAPRTFTPASNEVSHHAPAVSEVVAPGPTATSKKDTCGKLTSLSESIKHALLTGSLTFEKAEALLAAATTASSATIIHFEGMAVAPPEAPRTFTPASNEVAYHAPAVLEVVAPGPNASTSKKDTNGDTYVQPTNKKDGACSNNIHVPSHP